MIRVFGLFEVEGIGMELAYSGELLSSVGGDAGLEVALRQIEARGYEVISFVLVPLPLERIRTGTRLAYYRVVVREQVVTAQPTEKPS